LPRLLYPQLFKGTCAYFKKRFGPVFGIPLKTTEEAIEIANDTMVWVLEYGHAMHMKFIRFRAINPGRVWVNHNIALQVPFGGYKQSIDVKIINDAWTFGRNMLHLDKKETSFF
jgi:hypothetical protein